MAGNRDLIAGVFRLADKTSGRDKLCRVVQYGSKFVSWVLELEEVVSPAVVQKIRDLESSISTARKLFRLGKSVDNFRGALRTIHLANPILRLLITLLKLNRGIYLLFDHVIWAARMKLVVVDMNYWHRLANRFWLVAIILGLLRDIYDLLGAIQVERNRLKQYGGSGGSTSGVQAMVNVVRNNPPLMIDIVKNGADALIPASRLELVYVPSGIIGLLGVVSSLAGLVSTWDDRLRLKFS